MNKKISLLIVIVFSMLILFTVIIIAGALPDLGGASDMTPGRIYPTFQEQTEIQVTYGGVNYRLLELNRVLGITMEELQKLTPSEVEQLYIDNAEKLGVRVYQRITENGHEVIKLIAGNKVFKPEPAIVSTPTLTIQPYPAP